ncbi:type IX secretion system protein PorG [Mangrovimonas aestuarii]|uniref:type IX secretion system protein PorG n=1 Tax=Mangrovimonas aestuarii TaxID=3018443 RepID=UPI00237901FB|nr:DUF6089 family protein [Mangrovimonas aestuarii]
MRSLTILLISILSFQFSYSQIYELGGFIGGSNFIGDVGATNFIAPKQLAIGGMYRWNRSPRHAYRITLTFTDLQGKDSDSDDPRRKQRNYEFSNNIVEIGGGIEYTFWEFDLHRDKSMATPYLFTGLTAAHFDNYYFNNNGIRISEDTSSWAFGIPMAIGVKTTFLDHFILGFEIAARYTFTDELDGSVADSKDREQFNFGNTNNNDWYVFTGVTLTYTFGRNPCYCIYK